MRFSDARLIMYGVESVFESLERSLEARHDVADAIAQA